MKNFFIRLSLISALLFSFAISAWAADAPALTLDTHKTSVAKGDSFTVALQFEQNPGFDALQLDITFDDDILTCTNLEAAELLSQDDVMYVGKIKDNGVVTVAAIRLAPVEGNGDLVELTFVAEKAGSCDISIEVVCLECLGSEISPITDTLTIDIASAEDEESPSSDKESVPDAEPAPDEKPEETAASAVSFKDVPATHWAHPYVQSVVRQGLFGGMSADEFGPTVPMTRGMFVTVLYRCAGSPEAGPPAFSDVKVSDWFAKGVAWANENGIVGGIGDGQFGPNMPITREQLALILYQYSKGTSPGTEAFVKMFYPDGSQIHDWALTATSWAINEGLISGKTGNYLAPRDTATRAEVAVIMQNFMNPSKQ